MVSAYVNPRGANYHGAALLGPLNTLLDALAERQNPSGLYDIGNLDSPPDTSFVISDLGLGYDLLASDDQARDRRGPGEVRGDHAAVRPALAEGGVHTPNHRWEICKALAHLNHLFPSRLLMARINDWLGEGIDQDAEGEYSERSPNYASEVTNRSLVTIARLADKPRLLGNVRRNLALTFYRMQVNGEVETVQSRRQDQTGIQDVWKYLTHFRELAIVDGDGGLPRWPSRSSIGSQRTPSRSPPPATRSANSWPRRWPTPTSRRCSRASQPLTRTKVLRGIAAGADPPRRHHREHLRRNRLAQQPAGFRGQPHHHPRDRLRAVHQPDILQTSQG